MIKTIWKGVRAVLSYAYDTTVYAICPVDDEDNATSNNTGKSLSKIAKDVHNMSTVLTKEVWPKANQTMNSFNRAMDGVERASNFVAQEAWPEMNQSMTKLTHAIDGAHESSQFIASKVWPGFNETMVNFNQTMNKVDAATEIVKNHYWPELNKTMTNLNRVLDQVYVAMTNQSSEVKENIITKFDINQVQFVILFLGLCLALGGILLAAHQTKRLLSSRNHPANSSCTTILHYFVESLILYIVYWLSLVLSLILVLSVFILAFQNLIMSKIETLQIREKLIFISNYVDLSFTITLSLLLPLAILLCWQRNTAIAYVKYFVQLPLRLMMDRPSALLNRHSSSYIKASIILTLHSLLVYTIIGLLCIYLFQQLQAESTTLQYGIGVCIILFYVLALLSYALGTLVNLVLRCFTGRRDQEDIGLRALGTRGWTESTDHEREAISTGYSQSEERLTCRRRIGYQSWHRH